MEKAHLFLNGLGSEVTDINSTCVLLVQPRCTCAVGMESLVWQQELGIVDQRSGQIPTRTFNQERKSLDFDSLCYTDHLSSSVLDPKKNGSISFAIDCNSFSKDLLSRALIHLFCEIFTVKGSTNIGIAGFVTLVFLCFPLTLSIIGIYHFGGKRSSPCGPFAYPFCLHLFTSYVSHLRDFSFQSFVFLRGFPNNHKPRGNNFSLRNPLMLPRIPLSCVNTQWEQKSFSSSIIKEKILKTILQVYTLSRRELKLSYLKFHNQCVNK